MARFEKCWGIYMGKGLAREYPEPIGRRLRLFLSQTFSRLNTPTFLNSSQTFSCINTPTFLNSSQTYEGMTTVQKSWSIYMWKGLARKQPEPIGRRLRLFSSQTYEGMTTVHSSEKLEYLYVKRIGSKIAWVDRKEAQAVFEPHLFLYKYSSFSQL